MAVALVAFIALTCGGSLLDPPSDGAHHDATALKQAQYITSDSAVAGRYKLQEIQTEPGQMAKIQLDDAQALRQVRLSEPLRAKAAQRAKTSGQLDLVITQDEPLLREVTLKNKLAATATLVLTQDSVKRFK